MALESGPLRTSFSPMQTSCNDRSPTTPPSCSETSDPISAGPYSPETCCIYHRECRTEVRRLCESHTQHYHYRYILLSSCYDHHHHSHLGLLILPLNLSWYHHYTAGVTIGESSSTTISIGFRAPNYKTVMTALLDEICTHRLKDGDSFYRDGDSLDRRPISRGTIASTARNTIADHIKASVSMTHLALCLKCYN